MAKQIYIVQSDDSLSKIARDVIGELERWPEIAYINSIDPPYILRPGQQLLLPSDEPLQVTITGETSQAAPTRLAQFSFNPATVAIIVIGAALIFWDDIFK